MKSAAFSYARVDNAEEACALLARYGEEGRILAGGQSLGAMLNMRLVTPALVIDINRASGLDMIEERGDGVVTGALVRQADALSSAVIRRRVPLLAQALPHVGHYQTRSRGTLAGSVAHADPSAEIPLVLCVLDGAVELSARRRRRTVKARDFFKAALVTDKAPDEMIVALHWPVSEPAWCGFREFSMRAGDYAIVAAACSLRLAAERHIEQLSLGFAGCADRPQIVATRGFEGQRLDRTLAAEIAAATADSVACKGDLHASAGYRRNLVRVLAEDLLVDALSTQTGD
jgi:2-furoyl-CoA dehydrogenase FAD binding subunit